MNNIPVRLEACVRLLMGCTKAIGRPSVALGVLITLGLVPLGFALHGPVAIAPELAAPVAASAAPEQVRQASSLSALSGTSESPLQAPVQLASSREFPASTRKFDGESATASSVVAAGNPQAEADAPAVQADEKIPAPDGDGKDPGPQDTFVLDAGDVQVPEIPKNILTQSLSAAQAPVAEIEPNGDASSATPLGGTNVIGRGNLYKLGNPANPASLASGDIDYWSFSGNMGDRVYAAVMAASSSNASQDSQLTLIGTNGVAIIEFDDDDGAAGGGGGFSSTIAGATLPSTGTFYLKVNHFSATAGQLKPYFLHLRVQDMTVPPTAEVEANNTPGTANPLPANGWVSGARDPALATEQDWFSFAAAAGDTVYLSLDLDPERDVATWNGRLGIALFGDAGTLILVVDDAGAADLIDSEAMFMTVKTAGTYYAFVDSATAATGGPTATYNLSVSIHPATPIGTSCTVYTSADPPLPIGPALGAVTTSTIVVPGTPQIEDLNVSVTLTHAIMADIDAHLTSPAGNTGGLFTDIGSAAAAGQTMMDADFDDEAGTTPAFTVLKGAGWTPELSERLHWYKGENGGGVWTLTLRDDLNAAAGGTLTSWSITICEPPPPPVCAGTMVTVYSSDFEAGDSGFTHAGVADEWARGLPAFAPITTCNSGINCWKTDLIGNYNATSNQELLSPTVSLSGLGAPIRASWAQKYAMESSGFDTFWAEVREPGPTNVTNLYQFLDATMSETVSSPSVTVLESAGWGLVTRNIDAYANKPSVQLRWVLTSDASIFLAGLGVDDVTISACCTPASCDDGDPCTNDTCDPMAGCVHTPALALIPCDDGNPCTDDMCVAGVCVGTPDDTNMCSDNNACTNPDTCSGGMCVPGAATNCDDMNACTVDSCNPMTGMCEYAPFVCDDMNTCTDDVCVPPTGCVFTPNPMNMCTDNNLCTSDVCNAVGTCVSTPIVICDDMNPCTDDTCDPMTGMCVFTNDDTNTCADANPCTIDVCVDGVCQCPPCVPTKTNHASIDVPKVIPGTAPPNVVVSTLAVAGAGPYLVGLDVTTFIVHTWSGDIDMTLTSPMGTSVTLTSDNGAGNDNNFNGTVWDDSANPGGQVPYLSNNGVASDHAYANLVLAVTLAPEEAMAAFVGEDPNGVWTLTISDDADADGGLLDNWSLNVTALDKPPVPLVAVFPSPDVPKPIPAGAPIVVASVNPVGGMGTRIGSVKLFTALTHTANDNIDMTLRSPGGRVVTISTDNGGLNDDVFLGTMWDDKADPGNPAPFPANTFPASQLATDTTYVNLALETPLVVEEALGAFIGDNPNGLWTLTISDDTAVDGGVLLDWALEITTVECPNDCETNCDDGLLCTIDSCDPILGCIHTPIVCDDMDVCTDDFCDTMTGLCDTTPHVCDDMNACTDDICTGPVIGCEYINDDTNACSDVNDCTDDACVMGVCVGTPDDTNACSDGNDCTIDVCSMGVCTCPTSGGVCVPTDLIFTNMTPVAIADNVTSVSTLAVAGAGPYLYDLDLTTFITHTWAGDMDIVLTSPAGTMVTISSDDGGSTDNVFNGTVWNDDADPGNDVPFATATFAASNMVTDTTYTNLALEPTLVPEEALAAFIGENPNGIWTIKIHDDAAGDSGSLASWSLKVSSLDPAPTESTLGFADMTPVVIPTGPGPVVTSTIVVAGAGTQLKHIRMTAGISHTNNADLDITLVSPAGTIVTVTSDNGGINDDVYKGTVWDDDADPGNDAPFPSNTFAASQMVTDTTYVNLVTESPLVVEEAFGAFVGENPNGIWTLKISDDLAANGGALAGWTLDVTTIDCTPPCAVVCNDMNPCTDDTCDPMTGCVYTPNMNPCDDGNLCTSGDVCGMGVCAGTPNMDPCDDGNPCTDDACSGGACVGTPDDTNTCSDGSACTTDVCSGGMCVGTPTNCDDMNVCTNDSCDPMTGLCVYVNNSNPCDDGNACTSPDVCYNGVCSCGNEICVGTFTVHASTDVPKAIPATAPPILVSSVATVGGAGTFIADLNVRLFVTHTFSADLEFTLTSPLGTSVTLTSNNGGGNDNNFNGTIFNDQANPGGQVPYVNNNGLATDHAYLNLVVATPLASEEALGAFIGEDPNGTWTLKISDDANLDGGSLDNWALELTTLTAPPTSTTNSFTDMTVVPIPATGGTVSSTVVVSGMGVQTGRIRITTGIQHIGNSDLDITVMSPSGTIVTLTTDNGGALDDVFKGTLWDDKADPGNPAPSPAATFPASQLATDTTYIDLSTESPLVGEEGLAAFNGQNPNGTWTLTINDDLNNASGGTLIGWTVEVTTVTCGSCAVICDDMNPCTDDACDPMTGMCVYTNDDTNACSDGDPCTSDACMGGMCVGTALPQLMPVNLTLLVNKPAPGSATGIISWTDPPGPFNVYRGLRSSILWSYNQSCYANLVPGPEVDMTVPPAGQTYYYLVTRDSATCITIESNLGVDSAMNVRPNTSPCP